MGEVEDALTDLRSGVPLEEALDVLEPRLRVMEKYVGRSGARPENAESPRRHVEVPPNRSALALAQILADEAAERPSVRQFRESVLGNRLLKTSEMKTWVRKHLPEGSGKPREASRAAAASRTELIGLARPYDFEDELAEEGGLRVVQRTADAIAVTRVSVLGQLAAIGMELRDLYGWFEPKAVRFVLTGDTPSVPMASIQEESPNLTGRPPFPAEVMLVARLSPRLSVRNVQSLYRLAKEHAPGKPPSRERVREPTPSRADLAVFAHRYNDGRTWLEAMKAWNGVRADTKYKNERTFARDARQAFQSITDSPLVWKNPRGRPRGAHR
ncbi:MAG: hypothetical protein M3Q23_03600 [Actinomycetota bacterium]|nr:hypothetical protein [Actinomycetota bacterium]